jgi:hypothetical protein
LRVASLEDFALRQSDVANEAELCANIVAKVNITPYCLDHSARHMVFAETQPGVDLSHVPFYYQRQFELATRLISLPYENAHWIAGQIQPQFEDLILIFSVGRCGSTLLSKIWGRLDDTLSLSEPDVFTELNQLHQQSTLTDDAAVQLLGDSVRLVYRTTMARKRFVLKFRAPCIESAELMYKSFPKAKYIFMYRNAVDCIDSHLRTFGGALVPESKFRRAFHAALPGDTGYYEQLGRLGRPLLRWATATNHYLALRRLGLPFVGLKYENLVQAPELSISQLFQHCCAEESLVAEGCRALAEDSQTNTKRAREHSRKRTLTASELEQIYLFFKLHAGIQPDPILEGTINA